MNGECGQDLSPLINPFEHVLGIYSNTCICILCSHSGYVSYDNPVSDYWPEFAQNGKSHVTVRMLLSHQASACRVASTLGHVYSILHIVGEMSKQLNRHLRTYCEENVDQTDFAMCQCNVTKWGDISCVFGTILQLRWHFDGMNSGSYKTS